MALTMKEKKAVTGEVASRYKKATKKEKKNSLDEFTLLTGYNHSYAARALREKAKHRVVGRLKREGMTLNFIEDGKTKRTRKKRRKYGEEVLVPLIKILGDLRWYLWQKTSSFPT